MCPPEGRLTRKKLRSSRHEVTITPAKFTCARFTIPSLYHSCFSTFSVLAFRPLLLLLVHIKYCIAAIHKRLFDNHSMVWKQSTAPNSDTHFVCSLTRETAHARSNDTLQTYSASRTREIDSDIDALTLVTLEPIPD